MSKLTDSIATTQAPSSAATSAEWSPSSTSSSAPP